VAFFVFYNQIRPLKKLFLLLFFCVSINAAFGMHLKGGFITYKYLGPGINDPTKLRYSIRFTIYMSCAANDQQNSPTIPITIFDAGTNAIVYNQEINRTSYYQLRRDYDDLCITNEKLGCYYLIVIYDLGSIELAPNSAGYTISYQRCCRIAGITNIAGSSDDVGNTYSVTIPGSNRGVLAPHNSSADFLVNDTAIICRFNYFELPFVATDPNGDSLSYSFCEAWRGGGSNNNVPNGDPNGASPNPAAPPPYPPIPYATGFSGGAPLGAGVTINSKTGIISGIAPEVGEYVITVCVNEYRSGVLIASTRKELHVVVGDCSAVRATLNPDYVNCKSNTVNFFNQTPNGITSNFWDFGIAGSTTDTSSLASPTFTYPDTGLYIVKLKVQSGPGCRDSTTATVHVFPGFFPNFTISGVCTNKPTQFFDATGTNYGFVNSWSWNFGDSTTNADTSTLKNPVYTYPKSGVKPVVFIVGSNKGCRDTLLKNITILDKPPLGFPFRDTLICNGDTLQLHGIGSGNFSWTPNTRMFNSTTADPTVFPNVTTVYTARLDDNGCINNDTVRVRVVNFVTLIGRPDTTICLTDSVQLGVTYTNGLKFLWTPVGDFTDPTLLNAIAHPTAPSNTYHLVSRIGHCIEEDDVTVLTVPYPVVNAGPDTTICYSNNAFLHGTTNSTSFSWSPPRTLSNPLSLNPVAHPLDSTAYVLTGVSVLSGCPKPVRDTVIVSVLPKINAFAGRDTAVIINQPLQFNASGGTSYVWSPATGLSNPNIPNPVGLYHGEFDVIRYKVLVSNVSGCADSAFITVKIFKVPAQVFVPTAFTPNKDGTNDLFRPIAVGITRILYFRVFNRWGQLVFSTTENGAGWDGKIKGQEQGTDVFVWVVKAIDFTGKDFFAKGTVTLIR
jgi:gliding motility-associated-like protein